jgi:putative oxidoreductase
VYPDSLDFALLISRVWIAYMIFMHGWRHLKSLRSGPGMANWFESLGIKPGPLHAQLVTYTELGVPVLLLLGFLTPLAYAGVCSLMLVAFMTNHLKNGFFLNTSTEGYEYVVTVAVVSITLGTFGAGDWSFDNAFGIFDSGDFKQNLLVTAIVGIGGAAAFLAAFWRPPKGDAAS